MAVTLLDCVAKFRRKYPACADSEAMDLMRDAYQRLCDQFVIATTRTVVPLVAGQSEYPIDPSWDGLRSVVYRFSSDPMDVRELLADFNLEERDDMGTLWRYQPPGDPYYAMVDGASLIVVPAPETGTPTYGVDAYPRLEIEATLAPVVGPNVALPPTIRNADILVYRACVVWAATNDRKGLPIQQAMLDDAVETFLMFARRRNNRQRNQSYPESYSGWEI